MLAGGEGKRLAPLTLDRAKPAVPFGGNYRLIDFALSNLVNAGYRADRRADAVQEPLARPPHRHDLAALAAARQLRHAGAGADAPRAALVRRLGRRHLPELQPAQRRAPGATSSSSAPTTSTAWTRARWSSSTSPAGAGVTVAALRAPIDQADQFGVIETAPDGRGSPPSARSRRDAMGLPDAPDEVFASMGNYVFTRRGADRGRHAPTPQDEELQARHRRQHHPDARRARRGRRSTTSRATRCPGATDRDRGYWRDVGTLDAYYDAHMDLISVDPIFNLYNHEWPIHTWPEPLPPAKFVFDERRPARPRARLDGLRRAWSSRAATVRRSVALAGRARALLRAGRGLGPHARRRGRPRRGRAQRDPRQERADRPRARRSASTPRPTASASRSRAAASS